MKISKKAEIKSAAVIKKIAGEVANVSFGMASILGVYQPKEPAKNCYKK